MPEPTNLINEPLQLCRLRATLLDDAGKPDPGAESVIVTDAAITLGYKMVVKAGAKIENENGCGTTKLSFQAPDRITGVDLTADFTELDAELVELLTGFTLVKVSGVTRGWALPSSDTDLDRRVSIEAWTKAYDGDQPKIDVDGTSVLNNRFVFPSVSWIVGDGTLQNQPLNPGFTGHGRGNAQFGDGPANDLPWDAYTSAMGVFFDKNALPAPTLGYATLVAS